MGKQSILLILGLALCMGPAVNAVNIIYVSENDDQNADGVVDDLRWPTWLAEQGFPVTLQRNNWLTLDAAKIASLNQADLVIVSRNTDSGDYDDGQEIAQWNSVTAPLLVVTPYLSRVSRWNWVDSDGLTIVAGTPVWQALVPEHAVFFGVSLGANQQVLALEGSAALVSTGTAHMGAEVSVGNGVVIAQVAGTGEQAIVEWSPGKEFRPGGPMVAGRRLLFCAGTTESVTTPQGAFNLTPVGQQMFLNAVRYMLGMNLNIAASPNPANGASNVPLDAILAWTPGPNATQHDVYFGTVFDDVNTASRTDPKGVLVSQGQEATTYDQAGLFDFGQTNYWRIDEVNAPDKPGLYQGDVWSFTIETYGHRIATAIKATASSFSNALTEPEKTIDGSGIDALDQHSTSTSQMWLSKSKQTPVWIQYEFDAVYSLHEMWVWNHNGMFEVDDGYGAKDVTIEVSTDGITWTTLAGVPEFAQATGEETYVHNTTVEFGGVLAKYVKLNINSNWSDAKSSGLSEVLFFYVPVKAFGPTPAIGATGVAVDGVLNWRPGRTAASHEVYLGTDPNALTKVGTVTGHTYSLISTGAEYDKTYYWKVNEVNEAPTPQSWEGDVWSFSTPEYVIVDNFESYDDNCNRIFYTWADGYGIATPECGGVPVSGNGSGSTVGNASAPYAEQTVVHGGRQSMPMSFDNPGATSYSEATRTFDVPQDWVQGGIKTLVLYFHGASDNAAGQLYMKINNSKVVYNGNSDVLTMPLWKQWNIDLASVGGTLSSVTSLAIGVSGSGKGLVWIDDIWLYRSAPAVVQPVDPGTTSRMAYYAMEGDAKDGSGKGYNGTLLGDPIFVDSASGRGKALLFDAVNDYVELPIAPLLSTLTSVSVTGWVNFDRSGGGTGYYERFFDFGTSSTINMFLTLRRGATGTMRFAITRGGSAAESGANAGVPLPPGWHHLTGVIDGTAMTIQLYLDGTMVGSGATALVPKDLGTTTQNWLGRSQYTADNYLKGMMDNVGIYNRALSEGEIRYLAGDK